MSGRLQITLFGTYHVVGGVHLTPEVVRAGLKAFGEKKWNAHISNIALGQGEKGLKRTVAHTIGYPIPVAFQAHGVGLHNDTFGLETFYEGHHFPINVVEAENRTLQPGTLMRQYKRGDMLAVFRAERDGAMFFRWDDVEDLDPHDVVLRYDTMTKVVPDAGTFSLALNVTWRGKDGRRPELRPDSLSKVKHLFHKAK